MTRHPCSSFLPLSVVMPVWNASSFVKGSVESVLAQTVSDFEFIVIDDGSDDGTADLVESYEDSRVRVYRRPHEGIVSALNFGIARAAGKWIVRQDADDESVPDRLARQLRATSKRASTVLCHGAARLFGDFHVQEKPRHLPRTRALLALEFCFRCPIVHSTAMFRKDVFTRVGGYLPEERHAEDFGLWGRLFEVGDVVCIPHPLVRSRRHPGAISYLARDEQESVSRRIATAHTQRFLSLSPADAPRAYDVLSAAPAARRLKDWVWLVRCVRRRLPYRSVELSLWLLSQTLRCLLPMRRSPGHRRAREAGH